MTTLRENIRRLRTDAGLTAAAAAQRARMARATWSDLENGANPNPTPRTLAGVAEGLGCTLAELFIDEAGASVTLD